MSRAIRTLLCLAALLTTHLTIAATGQGLNPPQQVIQGVSDGLLAELSARNGTKR